MFIISGSLRIEFAPPDDAAISRSPSEITISTSAQSLPLTISRSIRASGPVQAVFAVMDNGKEVSMPHQDRVFRADETMVFQMMRGTLILSNGHSRLILILEDPAAPVGDTIPG
jgi:hypothetical protein